MQDTPCAARWSRKVASALRHLPSLVLGLTLTGVLVGCGAGGGDTGASKAAAPVTVTGRAPSLTPSFAISTATLPAGQPGAAYPATLLSTVNAPAEVTFSLASGRLPEGLSLSEAGLLTGTPSAACFESFTVCATSGPSVATRTYGLSVGVFGLVAGQGLLEGEAWTGQPVLLSTSGATGSVRFEVLSNGSGGSFASTEAAGRATWLPGPVGGAGVLDVLVAIDQASGASAQVGFGVERDPVAGFVADFGSTDVWYVDGTGKTGSHLYATDFQHVLAEAGLRDPASTSADGTPTDRLAALAVRVALLRHLNLLYGRNPDGSQGSGLPITFAFEEPSGRERPGTGSWLPGASWRYSVIALADGTRNGVLGTAFTDGASNALHENNTTASGSGELGAFGNQLVGLFNLAFNNWDLTTNPVCASDLPALEAVLYGRSSPGGRFEQLSTAIEGLARSLAYITGHEIGHSLGLTHTNPTVPGSLMNANAVIAPHVICAFTASDMAALRSRMPGVGRYGAASKPSVAALSLATLQGVPEGGIEVCGQPERCDLTIAPDASGHRAGCTCGTAHPPVRRQVVRAAWAVATR